MRKQKKVWIMLLLMIVGALVGSALWSLLDGIVPEALMRGITVGTTAAPLTLDLSFVSFTFGMILKVNIGSILGIAVALLISLKV